MPHSIIGCPFDLYLTGTGVWDFIHAVRPQTVGGCRPQDLVPYLGSDWTVVDLKIVPGGLMRSQVIVAHKCNRG